MSDPPARSRPSSRSSAPSGCSATPSSGGGSTARPPAPGPRAAPKPSEPELAHALLGPAEVMGELVAQRALDLAGEQLGVVAEVALERVLIDHDAVLVAI